MTEHEQSEEEMDFMTWSAFKRDMNEMKSLSDEIEDGWIVVGDMDEEGQAYMYKRITKSVELKDPLPPMLGNFEYHLTFDKMFRVPKFCFIGFYANGAYIRYEDCLKFCKIDPNENPLTILTQMEHPVLQIPFYALHPCKTAELITDYFPTSKNKLISWLSTVGPVADLTLDFRYAALT